MPKCKLIGQLFAHRELSFYTKYHTPSDTFMLNIRLAPSPSLNCTKTRKHQKVGRVHINSTIAIGPMPVIMLAIQVSPEPDSEKSIANLHLFKAEPSPLINI